MTSTMTRPALVIYRWPGHGTDLRAYIAGERPLFSAEDVCAALQLQLDATRDEFMDRTTFTWPLEAQTVEGLDGADGRPLELFTIDQVRELVDEQPLFGQSVDFAAWFEEQVEQLTGDRLLQTLKAVTPAEPGRVDLLAGRTYSVARAAKVLSTDPNIQLGEQGLFLALAESVGWTHRVDDTWTPHAEQLKNGNLVVQPRRIPVRRELYPQIRITPQGIVALHTLLGGTAPFDPEPANQHTLVDVDE